MAVTRSALEYAKVGTRDADAEDFESELQVAVATYTHVDGAETDLTLNVLRLPAGRIRVYSYLSKLWASQQVATANLSLGYAEYTNEEGTIVVADINAFIDAADVGGGALDQVWTLPSALGEYTEFNSQDGIVIIVTIDTENIEDTDTINVVCVYSKVT
jgi:hypothetical protein